MRALYEARVGDLGPLDYLQVECVCGHLASVTAKDIAAAGGSPISGSWNDSDGGAANAIGC
jgi:hypothetical protein